MPAYRITLQGDASITILGVKMTYMRGRHVVDADTLGMLRNAGATIIAQEVIPEDAAMTSPFGGIRKNGYNVASASD